MMNRKQSKLSVWLKNHPLIEVAVNVIISLSVIIFIWLMIGVATCKEDSRLALEESRNIKLINGEE